MQEYFERELKMMKKELVALKTSMRKSAGIIVTTEKSISLDINLELNTTQTLCNGEKIVKIVTDGPALIIPTLEKYQNNIYYDPSFATQDGWANVMLEFTPSGYELANVFVRGSDTDTQTLKNGGTVVKTVKLTVRCSDDFYMEII